MDSFPLNSAYSVHKLKHCTNWREVECRGIKIVAMECVK